MANTDKFTHLSLCSGYSGIGLGLEILGLNISFTLHVEIEAFTAFNLVKKIEEEKMGEGIVWSNVKTFPASKFQGCFDILSGGFPCQPFSQAGKREATEDPRHLYPHIARIITACEPEIIFLENVEGIISSKTGDGTPVLLYVLRDLERRGYTPSWGIFSAEEIGAPHRRKRVFILAYRSKQGLERLTRNVNKGNQPGWKQKETSRPTCKSCIWPARPGQKQYGWEPPRVC